MYMGKVLNEKKLGTGQLTTLKDFAIRNGTTVQLLGRVVGG